MTGQAPRVLQRQRPFLPEPEVVHDRQTPALSDEQSLVPDLRVVPSEEEGHPGRTAARTKGEGTGGGRPFVPIHSLLAVECVYKVSW